MRPIGATPLYYLAKQFAGQIDHIYLHWTAGWYGRTFDDYHINIEVEDLLAMKNDVSSTSVFAFMNIGRRTYKFEFASASDYTAAIGEKKDMITFNDISGHAGYDDDNNILTVSVDLSKSLLDSENNGSFPLEFKNIQSVYTEQKGYTCSNVSRDTLLK